MSHSVFLFKNVVVISSLANLNGIIKKIVGIIPKKFYD